MSKPLVCAVFGARGTGKTAWTLQQLQRENPPRLVVWDFKHDPSLASLGTAHTDLRSFVLAMKAPRFRLRFLPDHAGDVVRDFERFCEAAWIASQLTMFVDELAEVSPPGKPPAQWRRCINVGREYRTADGRPGALTIYAASQRPAECDKSIFSNADIIHTGRLQFRTDVREMSKLLDVPEIEVQQLPDLHWIEKRAGQLQAARGVVSFSGGRAKKNPAAPPAPPPSLKAPLKGQKLRVVRAA